MPEVLDRTDIEEIQRGLEEAQITPAEIADRDQRVEEIDREMQHIRDILDAYRRGAATREGGLADRLRRLFALR